MTTFNDLSKQQLADACERFGITVDHRWSDKTLAAKLLENGVTIDQIRSSEQILGVAEDIKESAVDHFKTNDGTGRVIVKMDRLNPTYPIMGYKFTREDPYVVMDEGDANWIVDAVEGFRIVHPEEVAKFYKGRASR